MASNILMLEAIVRGIACGGYIATALIIARADRSLTPMFGALFFLCRAVHSLGQFPPLVAMMPGHWYLVVDIPSIIAASVSWLFVTEFFSDSRSFNRFKLAIPAIVLAIGVTARFVPPDPARILWLVYYFVNVGLFAHILSVVFRTWNGDLVEHRRLAVAPLFLLNVLYGLAVSLSQCVELFTFSPRQPTLLGATTLLLLSWLSVWVFGRTTPGLFKAAPRRPTVTDPQRAAGVVSDAEAPFVAELDRLMRVERLYRLENLRISALAMRLGVTEHRLRRLLNTDLGYRNFAAFVAHWRLAEAKEALADPTQVEVPISTIALDSGFQSLAPFNRAFKADTGYTPTVYRRRMLKELGMTVGDESSDESAEGAAATA